MQSHTPRETERLKKKKACLTSLRIKQMRGEDMQAFFTPLYVSVCLFNSLRGFCQQQSLTKGNSKECSLANQK